MFVYNLIKKALVSLKIGKIEYPRKYLLYSRSIRQK